MATDVPGRMQVAAPGRDAGARRQALKLLVALAWLPMILGACSRSSSEERLRNLITDMRDAIPEQKTSAFMKGVAPDFIGTGGLDQEGMRQLLRLHFVRNVQIGVTLGSLDVRLGGGEAEVAFNATLTGGSGGLLPDEMQSWRVRSDWRDGADGWQLVRASWEPVF